MHALQRSAGLALAIALLPAAVLAQTVPTYRLTDLGAGAVPIAINARGEVTGLANVPQGDGASATWRRGTWTALRAAPAGTISSVTGLNASGEVVGYVQETANGKFSPVLWTRRGEMVALLAPSIYNSVPAGISADGTVPVAVGTVPSLWNDGVVTPLAPPAPGDAVYIQAIADNGALAGIVSSNNSQWQLARHVATGWELIGAPSDPSGSVYGVNRAGHVVGSIVANGFAGHAFVSTDATVQDLHPANMNDSAAMSINTDDTIVGEVVDFQGNSHAYVWIASTPHELLPLVRNAKGWLFYYAQSINDDGVIVGVGSLAGTQHGFLLTPVKAATGD